MNNIRKYRRYTKTSFNELSRRSGVSPIKLQLIEDDGEATLSEIVRIASALGKPVSKVFPKMNFPKVTLVKIIKDTINEMCGEYCKYPDIYRQMYDDEDVALDVMIRERCDGCPLNDLI